MDENTFFLRLTKYGIYIPGLLSRFHFTFSDSRTDCNPFYRHILVRWQMRLYYKQNRLVVGPYNIIPRDTPWGIHRYIGSHLGSLIMSPAARYEGDEMCPPNFRKYFVVLGHSSSQIPEIHAWKNQKGKLKRLRSFLRIPAIYIWLKPTSVKHTV